MNGVDHVEPHTAIPALVEQLSADRRADARCTRRCPRTSRRSGASSSGTRPSLDVVRGELRTGTDYANLLPGVLSARVYLKQQNAHVQTLLESYAEPLSVFASLAGARYPAGELRHAWKTLLQNHPHDSICGCSIDAVHEENMTRFARARQVGDAVVDTALDAIADAVPAPRRRASSAPSSSTSTHASARRSSMRSSICRSTAPSRGARSTRRCSIARSPSGRARRRSPRSVGPDGQRVEFQVLGEEQIVSHVMSRFETPWALNVRRVHVLWWAPALPPCGYAAFDLSRRDRGRRRR